VGIPLVVDGQHYSREVPVHLSFQVSNFLCAVQPSQSLPFTCIRILHSIQSNVYLNLRCSTLVLNSRAACTPTITTPSSLQRQSYFLQAHLLSRRHTFCSLHFKDACARSNHHPSVCFFQHHRAAVPCSDKPCPLLRIRRYVRRLNRGGDKYVRLGRGRGRVDVSRVAAPPRPPDQRAPHHQRARFLRDWAHHHHQSSVEDTTS
jgi:hypothetical protein